MRIGIDVTWLKPSKSGGVESYFRNLLDGFVELEDQNEYILLMAEDNISSFKRYTNDPRITLIKCRTNANDVIKHLLWQNLHEWKIFKQYRVDLCFFPVYEMPVFKFNRLKTITTIHDIQAYHFPEYFPKMENIWYRIGWRATIKNSDKVVAISDFTKKDLQEHFPRANNLIRIHNPIVLNDNQKENFDKIKNKYAIEKNGYYYTVCSLHKHKNLITLIKVIEKIIREDINIPKKLVISGVSGPNKESLVNMIKDKSLTDHVILTKFVSNEERNCLIENCYAFLFPSLFEGFGMPPVEAMMLGARVVSTKETSLYEVTKNRCNYVENPTDVNEWISQLSKINSEELKKLSFPEYSKKNIAREYLNEFYKLVLKKGE